MKLKMLMTLLFVVFVIPLFFGCSSSSAPVESKPTSPPTTVVNNIYVTPDGVYSESEYMQTVSTTQQSIVTTESPITETTAASTELTLNEYTPDMIVDIILQSVNDAKQQQNFSAHQLQEVTISLTDCTFSWAVPVINSAIGIFNGPHHFDYSFVGGICPDPKEDFKSDATPMSAIPPSNRLFSLDVSGVVDYTAYEENGEYVYTVMLPFEYTDAQISIPYYHAQAMDYLDLNDFDFGIGEITDAVCNYPGATVTVRTDQNGKLLSYEEMIPMFGSGTGKLGIELSASFEGSMYECWTFVW